MSLLCRIVGHEANRRRAQHDNDHYWAPCKRCGTMLYRAMDGWHLPTQADLDAHESNLAEKSRLIRAAGIG